MSDKFNQRLATVAHLQQLITNWQGVLRATRGALVPDKYFWYLIDQSKGQWAIKPSNKPQQI